MITYLVLILELLLALSVLMSLKIKAVFCILGILFHFVIAIVHGLPAFFLNISALLILFSMDYRVFIEYINKLYNYWLTKNY